MSANDQRPKGQPSHVSNGSVKEEEAYMQQPPHPMRAWSEQGSDGSYGTGPMSTAVSDSFFPNYYPPNMSYPFMNQGMGGSEGAWSNGADTMFGMGYDYSNMYSGFGFPFNNWDYSSDYWGTSQAVRKDQRYPSEDAYYPPEMIPADSYGMVNGGPPHPQSATAGPESQEAIANVEQSMRNMRLGYRKDDMIPQQQQAPPPPPQQHHHQPPPQPHPQQNLQHVVAEGFTAEPSFMMNQSQPSSSVSHNVTATANTSGGMEQLGGNQSSKKTSWAAIASQPARQTLQMRPRTIPRAPVHPGKAPNLDIGRWDMGGNPSRVPMTMSQPLPSQPPPSLTRYARQPIMSQRQPVGPPTASVNVSNTNNSNSLGSNVSVSGVPSNNNYHVNSNSSSGYSSSSGGPSDVGHVINANKKTSNSNNNESSNNSINDSNNSNSLTSSGHAPSYSSYSNSSGNVDSGNKAVVNVNASINGGHVESQPTPNSAEEPVEKLSPALYNPKEFSLNHKSARYFIIKSYSEDDIHRSIKYSVWCSTEHGNRRLDAAFREREGKGPVYLIYSVNASGHFCGVAQMMTAVDYDKSTGIWHQDKWKGQFEVKWIYVKDVPNGQLRHIRLENNENKPVTNSRDTQEVPPEKGKQVLRIMHSYNNSTSIFDDFTHYEQRQELSILQQQQQQQQQKDRGGDRERNHRGGDRNHDRNDRDFHGGNRGGRDGYSHRGGDHHRNGDNRDNRNDNRDRHHGGGFDRERHQGGFNRDRNQGRYDRDSHHGGFDNRDSGDRGFDREHRNQGGFDREQRHQGGFDKDRHHGGFDRGRSGGMNERDNRRGGHRQH